MTGEPYRVLTWSTSIGRVLLAALPDAELEDYIASVAPQPLTNRTITDRGELHREILRVREAGYATTVDQLDYGITAIAVPIRGLDGRVIAALNSSGYTGIVTPETLVAERLPALRATASRISQAIGRYPVLQSVIGS